LVKFGVKISQSAYDYSQVSNICKTAEEAGFESFWIADHMYSWGRKPTADPSLECWTLLTALAVLTKRIRLGTLVICNLFRHPAILAKMSSSLDVISGGRLTLGIGACGPSTPFELGGFGISFPKRTERVERLGETLQILKLMWTRDKIDFSGKYYTLKDVYNNPKPVQKPHPPIGIGGERDDILKLAAKYANLWNNRRLPLEDFKQKSRRLDELCREYGRKEKDLMRTWQGSVLIARNENQLQEKLKKYAPDRGCFVGTPEKVIEGLQKYVDAGVEYFMLYFEDDVDDLKSLNLFSEKVIPALKK
jgi:alkanesulfonate monooxygenase SsuD/methylene tetrahydromethanopterin reductase-like flavin-dependent oxidoreductase (luciferase family)